MRARNGGRYRSTSYTAFALFSRARLLDFCRIVHVVREGRIVKRHVSSPDLSAEEKE